MFLNKVIHFLPTHADADGRAFGARLIHIMWKIRNPCKERHMRNWPILLLFVLLVLFGCSKDGHIYIKLENKHLQDTAAGAWLRLFNLDYKPGTERTKKQVVDKLRSQGKLVDEYLYEDGANKVKTYVWEFAGYRFKEEYYRGGIWEGPKVVPFQEYYNGGWNTWITVVFDKPISYSKLLPQHYQQINPSRKYEHTATVKSMIDQKRRLFLFGHGSRCNRISLF